jgi:glycosyltransferase involved in cell wall biosynthesis
VFARAGWAVRRAQESSAGQRLRAGIARVAAQSRPKAPAALSGPVGDRAERDLGRAQVTVIVPTYKSARTIGPCLESLRGQSVACRVVVVDNFSSDGTAELAASLADEVVTAGPERGTQRNVGARGATTPFIGFIDSDMVLSPRVVEEAVAALAADVGAVIVPERSIGSGFWAGVRQFERSFYLGSETVEAARFFRKEIFDATGGFDDSFVGGEDWDLHLRAAKLTSVGRTVSTIDHDESRLRFWENCAKKSYYAAGLRVFAAKHGNDALTAAVFDRPYLRRPWKLLYPHPVLGAGLVALKAGELAAVGAGLVRSRPGRSG